MRNRIRIDKLHRPLPSGELDVVFVIRREGREPRAAWIVDEEFPRQTDESADALIERALRDYRRRHPPRNRVSALIVDCSLGGEVKRGALRRNKEETLDESRRHPIARP